VSSSSKVRRRKYWEDISNIRRRVQNVRALVSRNNAGLIRLLTQRFGEEHPLVRYAWWAVQHVGQLRLTIEERLRKVERKLEQSRVYRQTLEWAQQYLDDVMRLVEAEQRLQRFIETLKTVPEHFEKVVLGVILDWMQGKYGDIDEVDPELQQPVREAIKVWVKRFGGATKWYALDLDSGVRRALATHYPKVRIQIYVVLRAIDYFVLDYHGEVKRTYILTVKTPYVVHADMLDANYDAYVTMALRHALDKLETHGIRASQIAEVELAGIVKEKL